MTMLRSLLSKNFRLQDQSVAVQIAIIMSAIKYKKA